MVQLVSLPHPEVIQFTSYLAPGAFKLQAGSTRTIPVSPSLPTIAGEIERYPLLGTDILSLHFVQCVHVVPGSIDIDRFSEALSKALSFFPTFSGRIRIGEKLDERWIELTNSPIPLVIDSNSNAPPLGDWTITGFHLGSYLAPINLAALENHDEPAMSIKLSYFPSTSETAIGLMMSHQIADGYLALSFLTMLSEYYQGIEPKALPTFVIPTPPPLPPISPAQMQEILTAVATDPRYQSISYSEREAYTRTQEDIEGSKPVNIRISAAQMAKLKALAVAALPAGDVEISRQDAVTALLVTTLNRFLKVPISHAKSVWNYRSICDPKHYGGNAISLIMTEIVPDDQLADIGAYSREIRLALVKARSPQTFSVMLPLINMKLLEMAKKGVFIGSVVAPGRFVMNSDVNTGYRAAHFGYPETVRFYSAHKENRYARVYQSNPEIEDGKVVDERIGSIDVHLRVDADVHDAFVEAIEETLRSFDSDSHVAKL